MKLTKAFSVVFLLLVLLLLLAAEGQATTYYFTGTGRDETAAIQALVNRLAINDTLVLSGNSYVSTVALWYKSGVIIQINGKVESIFTSEQTNKPYASISGNPVFGIFGGSDITITGSFIRNTYNEAIMAWNVSFLSLHCNIYGAGVGRFNGIETNGCSNLTISDCEISHASYKQPTSYYNGGAGISLIELNGGEVSNCRIHDNGSQGIYEYSGYNTYVGGNYVYSNGMNGIQFNFNAGVDSTTHFTIANNYIFNNRADGIDLNNNSGVGYNVWGLVQDNYFSNNGWEDNGATTPDGSGVATCIWINQIQLLRNLTVGSCRTGIFFSHCCGGYAYGNVVSKTQNSLDCGAYDEYGVNVQFDCNDLYFYDNPYPRENLKAWYINSVIFKDQYVSGGCIVYPGWPGTPPVGLTLTNTPRQYSNYYRYTTSSSDDFAILFGTPTSGYTSRVVAWTNGSSHSIQLPLSGTIKKITMSGQVSYIYSQNGWVDVQLTNSPVMLDVRATQGTTYYVKPDGNDSADGLTRATAWATIDNGDAKSILVPGDVVTVLPGTYSFPPEHASIAVHLKNRGGTVLSPITYLAKRDEGPVVIDWGRVDGHRHALVLDSANVHNVIIDGFELTGCSFPLVLMNGVYENTIRNCTIRDTTTGSISYSAAIFDVGNRGNVYSNNVLYNINPVGDKEVAGWWLQFDTDIIIRNNLVYNMGNSASSQYVGCVTMAGCTNTQLLNNTFAGGTNAIRPYGGCVNTRFTNNIVTNMRESGIGNWDPTPALINSYNLYFANARDYLSNCSKGVGEINANPEFIDAISGNYHLASGSAAIDAGIDIGLPFDGLVPDLGAFETVSVPAVDVSRLSDMKSVADGTRVNITQAMVVTAGSGVFADGSCYIEEQDRSCGIKAVPGSAGISLTLGERVTLSGTVETDANGERQLRISSVISRSSGSALGALGMDGKVVNGRSGLDVTGLLVKTWGRVISKAADGSYIEIDSGIGSPGARVILAGLTSSLSTVPNVDQYIAVTGLAGLFKDGTVVTPVIRPRNINDITTF